MNLALPLFHANLGCSLAIANPDGRTYVGHSRGVSDLYTVLTTRPTLLHGADVADKVVGKGAAALMVLGKIKTLHANIISKSALSFLQGAGIRVTHNSVVENIINRKGSGICPVESICLPCITASECLPLIKNFLISQSQKI